MVASVHGWWRYEDEQQQQTQRVIFMRTLAFIGASIALFATFVALGDDLRYVITLGHRLGHRPPQLSGGERQRVAIARAIVGEPAIVLADEPTGNLDSATSASIMDLLSRLHDEGATIVVITHEADIAARCHRQVVMRDGHIISDHATGGRETKV